jgi:hypothetical protein
MKLPMTLALIAALGALAWTNRTAFTEDEKTKPLTVAEMEAKMWQSGAPCPQHELLKKFIGTWTIKGIAKSAMMGDIPIGGENVTKSVMDGRFVQSDYDGGQGPTGPIVGFGMMGYNRNSAEYESLWMMSMGTNMATNAGSYDEKTKTLTFRGTMKLFNNEVWPSRVTYVFESADKIVETQYMTPKVTGKEQVSVKLTYSRKAEAAKAPTTGGK